MKKTISLFIVAVIGISVSFANEACSAETSLTFKEYLEQANEYIKAYRHFEAADSLKNATELGGQKHPSLHMRLAILYYGLGLIPEAITEGETAVALAPSSKWYKYDLAKFYYVDKQYDKAEQQFIALLKLDPGFTLGYYYLGELYFRKHSYDLAWLSMHRAQLLGHQGKHLENKLLANSSKPQEDIYGKADASPLFRFIKINSADEAQAILKDIQSGKLFENLELEMRKDNSSADFGVMMLNELKGSVAESLRNSLPYAPPVVIKTGTDYRIMQRILPFDVNSWEELVQKGAGPDAKPPKVEMAAIRQPAQPVPASSPAPQAILPPKPEPQTKAETSPKVATHLEQPTPAGDKPEEPMIHSNKIASLYAIEGWKEAWENQKIDDYLKAYSDKFTPPDGMSLKQWQNKRQKSISRPKYINITISDQVVAPLSATQMLVTFKQTYKSDNYNDEVVKTLTMEKEDDGWKIIDERVVEVIKD